MIKQLKNPMFGDYFQLKKIILSEKFPWYYKSFSTQFDSPGFTNVPFYSHTFLIRPHEDTFKYPKPDSEHLDGAAEVLINILNFNNIGINSFLRIAVNCIHPQSLEVSSVPHFDHNFDHKNLTIYLTDSGGNTVVEGEEFVPKEDDIILFQGQHFLKTPPEKRRINLVATFI